MTGYSNPFASGPIVNDPSQYRAFSASGTTTLTWPSQGYSTDTSLAWIMDITPASGAIIEMPDATLASPGVEIQINNVGSYTLDVRKNDGSTSITTVAPGIIKGVYLTDNTTANGTWRAFTLGAGTAATDISAAAGAGLITLASTLNVAVDTVDIVATPYTVSSDDRFLLLNNTIGSIVINLPAVASVSAQFVFSVRNSGTGTMQLVADGSETIDAQASITLQQTESCFIVADATSGTWVTVGRGIQSTNSYSYGTIAVTGGAVSLTSTQRSFSIQRYTGLMASNATISYGAVTGVWFVNNDTSGAYSLTLTAGGGDPGVAITQGTKSIIVNTGSAV
ncbi:MAG: hypothetical protein NTX56_04505 [Proteobacteria bacterium]|nr:hypothetical protein [Pseudomonadota bacterium]